MASSFIHKPNTVRPRTVRARRIKFSYPETQLQRHYVNNDLVMSHVISILSAMFPEGEDFFIRSVRYYSDRITDPELKSQVSGFIGQEVTHGREHRHINERLQKMGYPTATLDRYVKRDFARIEKLFSPQIQLAITAALEHYTAIFANILLTEPRARALLTSEEVRSLLLWHAFEEVEHKSVAFDVYRHIGGNERVRIMTMRAITVTFITSIVIWTLISLAKDRAAYNPRTLFGSLAQLRKIPWLRRGVFRELRKYTVKGFHPDDIDSTALLEQWRVELFGEQGQLVHHLV
ncbi:MAG: metal-dependent hydrolase [Mycobacteriaceae bacterium]